MGDQNLNRPDTWDNDLLFKKLTETDPRPASHEAIRWEVSRRLLESQVDAMEAQGKQIEAQSKLTHSLARAGWVLAAATILLAVATLLPWIWPRH